MSVSAFPAPTLFSHAPTLRQLYQIKSRAIGLDRLGHLCHVGLCPGLGQGKW